MLENNSQESLNFSDSTGGDPLDETENQLAGSDHIQTGLHSDSSSDALFMSNASPTSLTGTQERALREQLNTSQRDCHQASVQAHNAEDLLQRHKSETKRLREELKCKNEEAALLQKQLAESNKATEKLERGLVKMNNVKDSLCREKVQLKTDTGILEKENDTLKVMVEALQNKVAKMEDDNALLSTRLESMSSEVIDQNSTTCESTWQKVEKKQSRLDQRYKYKKSAHQSKYRSTIWYIQQNQR